MSGSVRRSPARAPDVAVAAVFTASSTLHAATLRIVGGWRATSLPERRWVRVQ